MKRKTREPKPFFKKSHKAWYVQTPDGKQHRLGAEYDDAAKQRYHELLAGKIGDAPAMSGGELTVAELVDDFLSAVQIQVRQGKLAERTLEWYDVHLQSFAKAIGTELLVNQLRPLHVRKWLDKSYAKSGNNHQNGAVRAVSRVCNWARKLGTIPNNPVAGFERPSSQPRECYLTDEQWKLVEAELKADDPFTDLVYFLYLTGCRPSEARTANDWHFDRDTKSLVFERVNSKGKKSRRVILLEGRALEIVERRAGGNFLFTNQRGNAWSAYALNCRFRRLRKELGFEIFAYIFRHTFVTNALKRGLNPLTVAALVGHCDATMIMRVYSHLCQDNAHLRSELRRAVG